MKSQADSERLSLPEDILRRTGVNVATCYQCGKCSAGCPMASEIDLRPHNVMRLVMHDQREKLLADESIWLCLTCETCSARCPNGCDPRARHRRRCARSPSRAGSGRHAAHHRAPSTAAFLDQIRANGRLYEIGCHVSYKLRSGALMEDVTSAPGHALARQARLACPTAIQGVDEMQADLREVRSDRRAASAIAEPEEEAPMTPRLLPRLLAARHLARVRREPARRRRRRSARPAPRSTTGPAAAPAAATHRPPARRGAAGAQPGARRGSRAPTTCWRPAPPASTASPRPGSRSPTTPASRSACPTSSAARSRNAVAVRNVVDAAARAKRRASSELVAAAVRPTRSSGSSSPPTTAACSCARRRSPASTTPSSRRPWRTSSAPAAPTPSTGT